MPRTLKNVGVKVSFAAVVCGFLLAGCGAMPEEHGSAVGAGTPAAAAPSTKAALVGRATPPSVNLGRERFPKVESRGFVTTVDAPLSTFSIDVDTSSYVHVRRHLRAGLLPPPQSVRIEEMINYFDYGYAGPETAEHPFAVTTSVLPNPWNPAARLLHVAVQGDDVPPDRRPSANLVFLVDVSGSMEGRDRLGLAKQTLTSLVDRLRPSDRVAIVSFANHAEQVLSPTPVRQASRIRAAIDRLQAGGGTGGEGGIEMAYRMLARDAGADTIDRIILISDGDFNVGRSDPASIRQLIEHRRQSGMYFSVLTVGDGNVNDHIAQALAEAGNGQAAHLDSLLEARKVLDDELTANLVPIADDVKIQVEFNPAVVSAYRLIGYQSRDLRARDFVNDRVDAGEIGSGHNVTALYEIELVGKGPSGPLRYRQQAAAGEGAITSNEFAFVALRYKRPGETESRPLGLPVTADREIASLERAPDDLRFAVAVAAFGGMLRGDVMVRDFGYDEVFALARSGRGEDPLGLRGEFIRLVRQAETLSDTVQ